MTMSDLEIMLRITHAAVSQDILNRQARRRHYMIRGLYCYSGRAATMVTTLDASLTIDNGRAANDVV